MPSPPDVVSRYYAAAEAGDLDAVLDCFADDAHVHDEDRDHYGRAEIRSWREGVATRFTYTTEITDVEQVGESAHVVHTHLEGRLPRRRRRPETALHRDRRADLRPGDLIALGMVRRPLDTGWTVRVAAGPAPPEVAAAAVQAAVPGVVHLDLLSAGLIPDPYLDVNEALLAWIGLVDWTYETTLHLSGAELAAAEHHELVFDGIDTVATVLLNGTVLAEVGNQHRGHRLDVTGILREGGNELEVRFRSPIRYANAQSLEYGPRPRPYPMPFEAIRKAACSFGWDWGPATFTSGIWRPVRLESWSTARLDDVRVHAEPTGAGALGRRHRPRHPHVGCRPRPHARRRRSLGVGNDPCGETSATASVDLVAVESWWPAGHGDPTLYDVAVSLVSGGEVVDSVTRRVGFRTLRWDTTPDAGGTPSSSSSTTARSTSRASTGSRTTRSRCAWTEPATRTGWPRPGRRTSTSCASGAEARQNVARLAHHASLALFTGNNENLWGHEDWGWKERLEGRTWGAHYYHELLPAVVAEIAPHVPYAPGSPFSPGGQHPNDAGHGTTHLWEQWNSRDWPTYREVRPRFVAEFGWQGPPAWSTLTSAISDDPLAPESPGMIAHQKAVDGNAKLVSGLLRHYRVPDDMETWHWAMQLNQANAVTCALEWFRSLALHNAGAVVWQLNDCWPVTSWAAIDGDGRENPLYFALQNAFAPRVATIQPSDGGLVVVLGNDCDEPWAGDVVLTRHAFDGSVIVAATIAASVPARSSVTVDVPDSVAEASDPASEVLVVEALGLRGLWFFCEPRDSALPAALTTVSVTAAHAGFDATVAAIVRDLTILVDKVDPRSSVDRGLVTLLPGESATFRVTGIETLDAGAVAAPGILRCGIELVHA